MDFPSVVEKSAKLHIYIVNGAVVAGSVSEDGPYTGEVVGLLGGRAGPGGRDHRGRAGSTPHRGAVLLIMRPPDNLTRVIHVRKVVEEKKNRKLIW